jgi:hypothetical protein
VVALGGSAGSGGTWGLGGGDRRQHGMDVPQQSAPARVCVIGGPPSIRNFAKCSSGEEGGGAAALYTPPLVPVGGFNRD